jgi:hypothetical protein
MNADERRSHKSLCFVSVHLRSSAASFFSSHVLREWLTACDPLSAAAATPNDSFNQARATGPLGNIPLIVLSQAPSSAGAELFLSIWYPLQDDLVRLSSRGAHVYAQGSGHMIALDRPDVVIAAIRDVVAQCRRQ